MIFDIKMEDFCHKARFVAGGHTTETPHSMTYASVVSRESVRLALTFAALNDVDVKMADIENAYLTAPITEKGVDCAWSINWRLLWKACTHCEIPVWLEVRWYNFQEPLG
jgi:hypothetical protein